MSGDFTAWAGLLAWPHWVVLPIVGPLMLGSALVLVERRSRSLAAQLSLSGTVVWLAIACLLFNRALGGDVQGYLLGNWPAPWGIALALDKLSATMVLLTMLLAVVTVLYAKGGDDARGPHFHAFFQFQLMGLCGAFLTADLFNLFVFFEVLLIASYALMLHGAGRERLKHSVHYVSFNLTGSALFLIAVSLLYGLTGTLNIADLGQRLAAVGSDRLLLAQTAALLLLVVFCVKGALLPLYFWLPGTYGSATAPVAALFAIMTKVGVYAVLRVSTQMFGGDAGLMEGVAGPWLTMFAVATLVAGAIGVLAAKQLRVMVAYGVVVSAGTLLVAMSLGNQQATAAGLFYLLNSTLAAAALFLLADRIMAARAGHDALVPLAMPHGRIPLAILFFLLAVASAGLPPLAGFLGKALLLQAVGVHPYAVPVITAVLASSLLLMVGFGRAGSALFWETHIAQPTPGAPASPPVARRGWHDVSLGALIAVVVALAVFAGPVSSHAQAVAGQLFAPSIYRDAVLGAKPAPPAFDVRREMREAGALKGDDRVPTKMPSLPAEKAEAAAPARQPASGAAP